MESEGAEFGLRAAGCAGLRVGVRWSRRANRRRAILVITVGQLSSWDRKALAVSAGCWVRSWRSGTAGEFGLRLRYCSGRLELLREVRGVVLLKSPIVVVLFPLLWWIV